MYCISVSEDVYPEEIIVLSSDEDLSSPYKKKSCLSPDEEPRFPFAKTTSTLPQIVKPESEPDHSSSSSERYICTPLVINFCATKFS